MPNSLVNPFDPFGPADILPAHTPEPRGTRPDLDLALMVSQVVMIQTRLAGEREQEAARKLKKAEEKKEGKAEKQNG
jgi:hypothetical protein